MAEVAGEDKPESIAVAFCLVTRSLWLVTRSAGHRNGFTTKVWRTRKRLYESIVEDWLLIFAVRHARGAAGSGGFEGG